MAKTLIALLFFTLLQRIALAAVCWLPRRRVPRLDALPTIQVFVVGRDEEASLPALLDALDRLDYDAGKLNFILVSDGSSDGTGTLMEEWCARRERAVAIRKPGSAGKKAGLQTAWLHSSGAELTALYDADVIPASNALRVLAAEFADPMVGLATGAIMPADPRRNLVSRYAALELWVYHQVFQCAKDRLRLNPPAAGAQSVYRSAALAGLGGFPQGGGMSDDLETSFAILRNGWKSRFNADAVVSTKVPVTLRDFWRQRHRWTRGLRESAWRAPGPAALITTLGYLDRLIFLAALVAVPFRALAWYWPLLYFLGPALNILVALQRTRTPARLEFLILSAPMFAVDLTVSLFGTLAGLNPFAVARTRTDRQNW